MNEVVRTVLVGLAAVPVYGVVEPMNGVVVIVLEAMLVAVAVVPV